MHIITKKRLKEFWQKHPDAEEPLRAWAKITEKAVWQYLGETRRSFPHADPVGECTVFNIGGNKYRLIAAIKYASRRVYVLHVLQHHDYDRGRWKDDCFC